MAEQNGNIDWWSPTIKEDVKRDPLVAAVLKRWPGAEVVGVWYEPPLEPFIGDVEQEDDGESP